jgi:xanthine dehydrogenase YagR molybdenum-binding subunit
MESDVMASAAAPTPKANMGEGVPRLDARLKVTGEARFSADTPVDHPAHAVLVTSSIAKGRLTGLTLDAARAVPGVLDILTAENTGELKPLKFQQAGSATSIQSLGPDILHDGQIIAVVLGDTLEAAQEGAAKVEASYAAERPSATFDAPGLTEDDITKVSQQHKKLPQAGDAEAALAGADVAIDVEYATPTQHHNPMELFSTTAVWRDDKLTLYEPSQFVYGLRNGVATRLGIDREKVRVVSRYVGGAFGSKGGMTPRSALVALAAKRLNRPVKLVVTRDQGFTTATYRAETRHHIRLGARRDGKISGYSHEGWEVTSRPDPYGVAGVKDSARVYAYGAVKTKVNLVHADRNTPGYMRSPPVVPYIYALESAMDELAWKLDMDPVELRRINDTMTDPIDGKPWSSRSLMTCYDQAAAAFGWKGRAAQPGTTRDGDWLIGWGCATALYPTHVGTAAARVRLMANGDVRVQTAAHEIGNGAYTVIGQVAADALGVPLAKVTVELGDTELPPAPVAGGSRTTASTCSAVLKACEAIRAKLFGNAAAGNDAPMKEAFGRLGANAIEEYAEFVPKGLKPQSVQALYDGTSGATGGPEGEKTMYAMGAEFVEVRVNAFTREIRVPRMVGAFAAGRLLNTRTVHSQLMGGMIWGISSALHEATEIDRERARYVNDNLADYRVPVNADVADVEVILVPEEDRDINPVGVKGLGELANVGTAAAVANAVYHATGVRVRALPIRIEKLLTA